MPIHKNPDGTWQWGKSGKKYKNKEDAVKQMKAIFANGYVEKKASSDFLYTYLPKLNTALTLGILGTLLSPNGWLKYKKRSGLNTKLEVIKYLNSLLPNRSKAFSAFSLPIPLDALLDYKLFARQKLLYKVKLALLIRDARILSIYKTGLGKLTTKVQQVTDLPIDWKTSRGLYLFSRIPHYIVAVKDGAVPPLYILKKASSLLQVLSGDKLTDLQAKRILALIVKLHRDHNKYLKQEPVSSVYKNRKLKYIKSPDTRIITDNPDKPNYVGMVLQLSDDPKGVRWLSSLYVKPLLRGKGIGEAIINQALKDSRLLGSLRLKIDYYAANPASRLYLRLGYKPQLIIALKLLKKRAAKSIDFPLELVLDLKKRLDSYQPIYTTRVDKLFDKYKKGDLLDNTLIDLPLYVALLLVILDLKAHRFLEHLTLDQKLLLKKYTKMNILKLVPLSMKDNPIIYQSAGTGSDGKTVDIGKLIARIRDTKLKESLYSIKDIPGIYKKLDDVWGSKSPLTINRFADWDLPRIYKADLNYPILLRKSDKHILDGYHRLIKAISLKRDKIKAYLIPDEIILLLAYKQGQTKKAALSLQLLKQRVAPYYTEDRKKHIQDVLKYALRLKGSKLSPLLLAIIYYHDILKKRVGGPGHLLAGAKFALKDLKKLYTRDQVRRVAQAIRLHSPDYRMSIKNFRHSSPLALLLALADDMNVRHRDPDNMAKISVKFIKKHPLLFPVDPLFAYNRHISYFGPQHSHKNLKYYKKLWDRLMARPMKLIDNYPKQRFMKFWSKIKADSLIPDIDATYYNPDNIVYE